MCRLCKENDGIKQSCPDCGRLICFDTLAADGVCAPARVATSGDVYCKRCADQFDEEDADEFDDDDYDWGYDDDPGQDGAGCAHEPT
jgi:hypothetical protein